MNQYNNWTLEEDGHVAALTLSREHKMNNLTMETLVELREISEYLAGRSDIWVVVLSGQGEHFSSGMDLNIFAERLDGTKDDLREFMHDQQRCLDAFEALEKVTIARLHGFCIGGGLMIAMCCDFRIASKRTIFSLPEIRLGIPITRGTGRVSRLIGVPRTKEMILLGKRYRANDALEMGLVHQVVQAEKLDRTVENLVERLLRLPPRTLGAAKRIVNHSVDLSLEENQELELDVLDGLLDSPDLREAIESFTENRPPKFSGI